MIIQVTDSAIGKLPPRYFVALCLWLLCFVALGAPQTFFDQLSPTQKEWLEQHPVIRVGAMDNWPPINFTDNQGRAKGIGADYVEALNHRLDGRLHIISSDWPNLYQQVVEKKLDAVLDITPKPEREPFFNFTEAYLNIPHVIVARSDAPYYQNENTLIGKTIALEKGFGNVRYFQEHYPKVTIREYSNTSEALGAVIRNEVDAYVGNRAVAMYIIKSELMQNLKVHGRAQKQGSILTIGIRKDWAPLTEILNLALSDMSTSEKAALQGDWVGTANMNTSPSQIVLTAAERSWLKSHPVIRLASKSASPPFEYTAANGDYRGIAADYIRLIETRLNIQFERSPVAPWEELQLQLQNRQLDVLSFATKTRQNQSYLTFTQPYLSAGMIIVTRDNVRYVANLNSLKNQLIATETHSIPYQELHPKYPALNFIEYNSTASALAAVAKGETFAYIGNIASASYIMREQGLTNLVISGEVPYRYQFALGIRSDWPELVSILNKTLATITEEERNRIFNQWVAISIHKGIPALWLIGCTFLALAVVAVVLYWNYLLNKKVADRTQQLEYRAQHDTLTQLPNRNAILNHVEYLLESAEQISSNHCFAVMFLDLDDFKKINDTLGHAAGDQLLQAVAIRLTHALKETYFIGRFGGDEFVIMTGHSLHLQHILSMAETVLLEIQKGFVIGERTLMITTSIGIAIYPNDGNSGDALLRHADMAMYDAKHQGGNVFSLYSGDMDANQHKKMTIEEQMLRALDHNEMYLTYQPIVNLISNDTVRFEALLRWENPILGQVSPEDFIPIAEQNGYILKIGDFVFQQAIAECKILQQRFNQNFSIAVNLSPRQFRDRELLSKLTDTLQKYQLPARNLIVEITEGVLMSDIEHCSRVLRELKDLGVSIAMDDFGKGYSSLSYVRNHPFDIIKIDREFVRDIASDHKDRQLVETTIAMSKSLELEVVAEGVENQSQVMVLRNNHCKYAQGYLFAPPMTCENLYIWLSRSMRVQMN
ncbi:EAL domain-containing protein [Gynuella sunshinyii]|uniref:Putative signal transduction protein containing a membrane domain, an EAL and a GGDEF domain n=1 Tax=Gynuella sunshinyii YC6258 TaxID=1445510 RepID=A0A0C5V5J6_9GAMM|nr:transporter substrate-binding domain-containing protein [Gynuella sunshinyii]AJQ94710.1 putative signal transduction protein containing a membrane domain, an EAL and a GGDEF domain [Gynuella sunshinyii YC6258]